MSAATQSRTGHPSRLRGFVTKLSQLVEREQDEPAILSQGSKLLAELVRHDDWLPEDYAQASAERYRQYLLYADIHQRFSVVSFVWGPGQETPVHNHTVWGLIGQLRGQEVSQPYALNERGVPVARGEALIMRAGEVCAVSPTIGDLHAVKNASPDATSISIHVYGGNIGTVQRTAFTALGERKSFVSGYNNSTVPNLWGPV